MTQSKKTKDRIKRRQRAQKALLSGLKGRKKEKMAELAAELNRKQSAVSALRREADKDLRKMLETQVAVAQRDHLLMAIALKAGGTHEVSLDRLDEVGEGAYHLRVDVGEDTVLVNAVPGTREPFFTEAVSDES